MAEPLMVFSMPSLTSDHAGDLLDSLGDLGSPFLEQVGIRGEQLDLDRLGRIAEIADHVLQHLRELDIELRVFFVDLGADVGDDFVDAAVAVAFEA